MKSLIDLPKTHMAGDKPVSLIRGVPVLEHSSLELISVKATTAASVVHK